MSQAVLTKERFLAFKESPPDLTSTYPISEGVLKFIRQHECLQNSRQMTPGELSELAVYIKEPVENLKGPFYVDRSLTCPNCVRQLTFLDFVKTIMGSGPHTSEMFANILSGRRGYWVTIAGKSEVRLVKCAGCQLGIRYKNHNYHSSAYNYYAF